MTRLPDGLTERLNPPKFFAVRPGSVTERPIGAAIMGADALSDVLRAVRLSSAMFFHLDVRAPCTFRSRFRRKATPDPICRRVMPSGALRVIYRRGIGRICGIGRFCAAARTTHVPPRPLPCLVLSRPPLQAVAAAAPPKMVQIDRRRRRRSRRSPCAACPAACQRNAELQKIFAVQFHPGSREGLSLIAVGLRQWRALGA